MLSKSLKHTVGSLLFNVLRRLLSYLQLYEFVRPVTNCSLLTVSPTYYILVIRLHVNGFPVPLLCVCSRSTLMKIIYSTQNFSNICSFFCSPLNVSDNIRGSSANKAYLSLRFELYNSNIVPILTDSSEISISEFNANLNNLIKHLLKKKSLFYLEKHLGCVR